MPTPPQGLCSFIYAVIISVVVSGFAMALQPLEIPKRVVRNTEVNRAVKAPQLAAIPSLKDQEKIINPVRVRTISYSKPIGVDPPKRKLRKKRRR